MDCPSAWRKKLALCVAQVLREHPDRVIRAAAGSGLPRLPAAAGARGEALTAGGRTVGGPATLGLSPGQSQAIFMFVGLPVRDVCVTMSDIEGDADLNPGTGGFLNPNAGGTFCMTPAATISLVCNDVKPCEVTWRVDLVD